MRLGRYRFDSNLRIIEHGHVKTVPSKKERVPALTPAEFPGLQQYAGQKVDNGPKAKAYANEYGSRVVPKENAEAVTAEARAQQGMPRAGALH